MDIVKQALGFLALASWWVVVVARLAFVGAAVVCAIGRGRTWRFIV
jgi:hypothetical protein